MRYSGHETFACRYTWLPKAYQLLMENPAAFADEDQAMVDLGVGKNMVRSIRFWVDAFGVAKANRDREFELTEFAHAIFSKSGFDPYLESQQTLWLLHWKICAEAAPQVFAWEFLVNCWPKAEFTRSEAVQAFARDSERRGNDHSLVTLEQHFDVFLRTYVTTRSRAASIEDSLDSPLTELRLIEQVGETRIGANGRLEPVYGWRRDKKPEISSSLFNYCLTRFWLRVAPDESTLTIRQVASAPGSLGQIFKLSEDDIRERLERFSSNETTLPYSYHPSAIQDLLVRDATVPLEELSATLLKATYKSRVGVIHG